jgi:dihydropteroate synthase
LIGEVREFLANSAAAAVRSGIASRRIALDPGLGFSKGAAQSAALLREIESIRGLGYPVVVGASRKNFARAFSGAPEEGSAAARLPGSLACAGFAARHGAAIVRVHDVAATAAYLKMSRAIENVTMGR